MLSPVRPSVCLLNAKKSEVMILGTPAWLCALTVTSELLSVRATTTLVPCETCVNIWLLYWNGALPAASSCIISVTNRLLQLAAVWRSCCSRPENAESSKQRRPGHLSAAQMCPCQTAIKSFFTESLAAECYVQSSIEFRVLKLEFRALTE